MADFFEISKLECEVGTKVRLEAPLRLAPGEIVGLVGPSGSGKSIFLRALALLDPAAVEGLRLEADTPRSLGPAGWRARVSYLPPAPALWGATLREDFERVLALRAHAAGNLRMEAAGDLLEKLGLAGMLGHDTTRLSTGERQRAALARLLWLSPTVLLLDEPTGALDPALRGKAQQLLTDWVRRGERARAAIWITHDHGEARENCTRLLQIDGALVREVETLP